MSASFLRAVDARAADAGPPRPRARHAAVRKLWRPHVAPTAPAHPLARTLAQADDSSSDDEPDERQAVIWKRVQRVLAEYCLTPLAMAAARKWVREMADPDNEALARLRAWMILRINGRERAAPPSPWQAGCPEILEGLRARPIWDASELPWLKPFEENAPAIRDELLALRSGDDAPG